MKDILDTIKMATSNTVGCQVIGILSETDQVKTKIVMLKAALDKLGQSYSSEDSHHIRYNNVDIVVTDVNDDERIRDLVMANNCMVICG